MQRLNYIFSTGLTLDTEFISKLYIQRAVRETIFTVTIIAKTVFLRLSIRKNILALFTSGIQFLKIHVHSLLLKHLNNESPHEKTNNLHMRKQRRRSASTEKLISAFVFATRIVHILIYLAPTCQASSLLL